MFNACTTFERYPRSEDSWAAPVEVRVLILGNTEPVKCVRRESASDDNQAAETASGDKAIGALYVGMTSGAGGAFRAIEGARREWWMLGADGAGGE